MNIWMTLYIFPQLGRGWIMDTEAELPYLISDTRLGEYPQQRQQRRGEFHLHGVFQEGEMGT